MRGIPDVTMPSLRPVTNRARSTVRLSAAASRLLGGGGDSPGYGAVDDGYACWEEEATSVRGC